MNQCPSSEVTDMPESGGTAHRLSDLGLTAGHCAVVGLQWGDEGKGKVVDLLAGGYDVVVRYNGGANAGHSLQVGDDRYALHLIPSGILYPDKLNVLGNGLVIDLEQVIKEINQLRSRGVKVADNFRISNRAHVVFDYHKMQDALYEQAMALAEGESSKIGTTGRGIGPCYADKAIRSTAVRMADLYHADRLREKLLRILGVKNVVLGALAERCGLPFEPFDADTLCRRAVEHASLLRPHVCDCSSLLHEAMANKRRLLFEGANATLLDIDHGTYPYVTSSNCSSLGVHTGTGVPGSCLSHVIGIVKAYQTRVGGGPMPTELKDATGDRIRERGREYGTTTGRPRRCGWLDLAALKYTAMVSGATGLAVMLLDVLSGLPELQVCTGYRYEGEVLETYPASADVLAGLEPVYVSMPGFEQPVESCRRYDDLPANARSYIETIEQFVGVPVVLISVGPRRDQTILRGVSGKREKKQS